MASTLRSTMRKRSSMLGISKDACRILVSEQREGLNLLCCSSDVAAVARVARVAQARRHSRLVPPVWLDCV